LMDFDFGVELVEGTRELGPFVEDTTGLWQEARACQSWSPFVVASRIENDATYIRKWPAL